MARAPQFAFSELDSKTFSLTSTDFDLYAETFAASEREGGGYDWEAVGRQLLRANAPNMVERVDFDSEASMFCATSADKEALIQLESLMRSAFTNKKRLASAIRDADEDDGAAEGVESDFRVVLAIHYSDYIDEFESLCESLESGLSKEHVLVYSPRGAGESMLFIRTNDARAAFRECKPHLAALGVLDSATVAHRLRNDDRYKVIWPRNDRQKFEPRLELCPSIP